MAVNTTFNPTHFHQELNQCLAETKATPPTGVEDLSKRFINLFLSYRSFARTKDLGRQLIYDQTLDKAIDVVSQDCPEAVKAILQAKLHLGKTTQIPIQTIDVKTPPSPKLNGHPSSPEQIERIVELCAENFGGMIPIENKLPVSRALNFGVEARPNPPLSLEDQLGLFLKQLRDIIHDLQTSGSRSLSKETITERIKQISTRKLCESLEASHSDDPPYELITQLTDLDSCTSLETLKAIERAVLEHGLIKQKVLADLQNAFHPLMFYLAKLDSTSYLEAIDFLEKLRIVLRRWGFVEANNHIGGQEDMLECLQKLYDFLKDDKTSVPKIKCEVLLSADQKEWLFEDLGDDDYLILGEKFLKYEKKGSSVPRDRVALIVQGKEYAKTLVSKGSLDGVLVSTEEVVAPHLEEKEFSPFLPIVPHYKNLLPAQDLHQALAQSFDTQTHRIFYTIAKGEEKIKKVTVPVTKRLITFTGHPPLGLFISRQVGVYEQGAFAMPPIEIPALIHLQQGHYHLKMAAAKSGWAQHGHYVSFLDFSSQQACYADSLEQAPLRPTDLPFQEIISKYPNICVCSYHLENGAAHFPPIQRKLYQKATDNLCYLVLVVQAIYGNPLFKSINAYEEIGKKVNPDSCYTVSGPLFSLSDQNGTIQNPLHSTSLPTTATEKKPRIFEQPLDSESKRIIEEVTTLVDEITHPDNQIQGSEALRIVKLEGLKRLLMASDSSSPFSRLIHHYQKTLNNAVFSALIENFENVLYIFRLMNQDLITLITAVNDAGSTQSKKRDHAAAFGVEKLSEEKKQLESLQTTLLIQLQDTLDETIEKLGIQLAEKENVSEEALNQYGLAWWAANNLSPDIYPGAAAIKAFKAIGADFEAWQSKHIAE